MEIALSVLLVLLRKSIWLLEWAKLFLFILSVCVMISAFITRWFTEMFYNFSVFAVTEFRYWDQNH